MSFDDHILGGVRVLAAIVDSKSFARAGDAIGMSHSGISRALARLEKRLNVRLLERTTRSVRPTEEGRLFYQQVAPLLAALDEITESTRSEHRAVRGKLRVNVDPFFAREALTPVLGNYLRDHPGLDLELVSRDQLGDIIADGFDLAIRFGHPRSSSLVARKLLETRIVTAAAPAFLERFGKPSDPLALERGDHECIQFRDPETGRPFPWEFHRERNRVIVQTRGSLVVNEVGALHGACLAGIGIAQLMQLGIERHLAEGTLVPLFPEWADERFPLYAYYPSRHYLPAKTRTFLDFVADAVDRRSV